MSSIYQQQIIELYKNPENFGELDSPTHVGKVKNLACGDELLVYLIVKDNKVFDVSFTGRGCAISIAAMSLLSDEIKGKTLEEVKSLDSAFISKLLGIELSPAREKCGVLGIHALKNAIDGK